MADLSAIKKNAADRDKVNIFLDLIGENDVLCRNEVLAQCSVNTEAMKYYVDRCKEMQKMRESV